MVESERFIVLQIEMPQEGFIRVTANDEPIVLKVEAA